MKFEILAVGLLSVIWYLSPLELASIDGSVWLRKAKHETRSINAHDSKPDGY